MPRPALARTAVVVLTVALAACAGDEPASVPEGRPATLVATTAAVATTAPSPEPTAPGSRPELPDVTAVAELGYPRDLLDRGRVNVVVSRPDAEPFVVLDHQLHVDGFSPAPPEERRIVIPVGGQRVAIQAVFGEVVDCDAPTPLRAELAVHYTFGDDPTVREDAIELDDTATLAEIRARFCTARRVLAENDVSLGPPKVEGETFTLDLTITRRSGEAELVIDAIQGTVLFGVESAHEQGAPERTLPPAADQLVLPLTFDVNRCDPHAVAETTRKKGLTLWIAVDGEAPQPVDVDITAIEDELEEILDRCKARTER